MGVCRHGGYWGIYSSYSYSTLIWASVSGLRQYPCTHYSPAAQVKSLMTSVPRETQLMVTVQRAANLPARMLGSGGIGGGGGTRPTGNRGARQSNRFGGGGLDTEGDAAVEGPSGLASLGISEREAQQRNCFVEIRFRSLAQRTEAVPGEFPLFNEQVRNVQSFGGLLKMTE